MKRVHTVMLITLVAFTSTASVISQDARSIHASEDALTAKIKAANAILWEMKNLCARLAGHCGGLGKLFTYIWDAKSVARKADAAIKAHEEVLEMVNKCTGCSESYKSEAQQSLKNTIKFLNEYREAIKNRDWARCSSHTCT